MMARYYLQTDYQNVQPKQLSLLQGLPGRATCSPENQRLTIDGAKRFTAEVLFDDLAAKKCGEFPSKLRPSRISYDM